MKHHRSPTHSYPQDAVLATLALRHPTTHTLLLADTPPLGGTDDLQSNAWLNPRAGLGISCDAPTHTRDQPSVRHDGDQRPLARPALHAPWYDWPAHPPRFTPIPGPGPSLRGEHTGAVELGLDTDIDPPASDIIGLIPDVNMYTLLRPDITHTGVNPLDTIRSTSLLHFGVCFGQPAPSIPHHTVDNAIPATDARPEHTPSPRVIQDIMSILVHPNSDVSRPPTSSPPPQGLPPSAPRSPASVAFGPAHVLNSDAHPWPSACNFGHSSAIHPSPVLNAHLGIELGELISRAERFRNRFPDRDIDRAWLSHFAGKLSDRGELLNDFRCYVVGCDQRNKRRDHILVHVGAHIGQRPFACSVCPLRFLRKNECKRHEASHSGFRPYSCDICGQSFVRQDLVKRHVKRTHGLRDENQSGMSRRSRKKARPGH